MLGLSESFFASKSTTLFAAALAFLAAALLLSVIFRFAFGRRLRLPRNGSARLPRLGTVDAFDLDRQRQLVIIRRDNVEHLLMIGGPNDLVIESQIIRAESREPRDFRDARIRDKESREKELRDAPPLPAGVSWPSPAESPSPTLQRKKPFPPAAALEAELGVMDTIPPEESKPELAFPAVLPSPGPPAFPLAPRRASPAAVPSGQRLSNQRESLYGRVEPSQRLEPVVSPAKELRRASVATPFLRSSTQRQAEGAAVRLTPSSAPETPPALPDAPNSQSGLEHPPGTPGVNGAEGIGPAAPVVVPVAPAAATGEEIQEVPAAAPAHADLDTLEAEMAKLLGRGPR